MIKALTAANRSERDAFRIPRSVQQSIPIRRVCSDGIWLVGRKHSRTWRFADINYAAASEEDQRGIFTSYGGVLNSLPTDAAAKITIINRRLNSVDFQRTILMKERGDHLDKYRREANRILTQRAAESNNLVQEECLKSETARLMLANSEFLLLFNQAATDRAELGKLLHISDTQMGYVTNAEAGHGLLRIGGSLVPFANTIPKDTELYRLMSTTPGEGE